MKCWHDWLLLKLSSEGVFINNQLRLYFMERTDFFGPSKGQEAYEIIFFWFLMEDSILKIFGSIDVKITPDFLEENKKQGNLSRNRLSSFFPLLRKNDDLAL